MQTEDHRGMTKRNPEAELATFEEEPIVRRALTHLNEVVLECDRLSAELMQRTQDVRRIEPEGDVNPDDSVRFGVPLADQMVPMLETAQDVRTRLLTLLKTLEV